jgi:hypothetical protein
MHDTAKVIAETYEEHVGKFVVVERRNGKKAIGVLKKITPDHKLDIRGDYTQWVVDPEEIVDFTARVDRHNKREGEKHQ